jgi:hypothetical protein
MALAKSDWRPLRLVKDLVRPPSKAGTDPRSISALAVTLRDKSDCVLFVTFPGSGWNWTADIFTYATLRHFDGPVEMRYAGEGSLRQRERFPIDLVCPADTRARSFAPIRQRLPGAGLDYCFHTHGLCGESPLWGLDRAKTVLIVRDVPTALYSYFQKRRKQYETFEDCLDQTGVLERAVRFYESWAQFRRRAGSRHRTWRYEDMLDAPKAVFAELLQYAHGWPLATDAIDEAVNFFDFRARKKAEFEFVSDESAHFYHRGARDYRNEIKPETMERIERRLADVPIWFRR